MAQPVKVFVAGIVAAAVAAPLIYVGLRASPANTAAPRGPGGAAALSSAASNAVSIAAREAPVATPVAVPPPDRVVAVPRASVTARAQPSAAALAMTSTIIGRVAQVNMRPGDKVAAGDLLLRLEAREAQARVEAAMVEVAARRNARDRAPLPADAAERRFALDAVWMSELRLAGARDALDWMVAARGAGKASGEEVAQARLAIAAAEDRRLRDRDALAAIDAERSTSAPTAEDDALAVARAQLMLARAELEATRVRAPVAGTVSAVHARAGETVTPDPSAPLVVITEDAPSPPPAATAGNTGTRTRRAGESATVK
ncbi:MAG: biotin/lipoyl-binding protein [Proteobacteria bacterium]|nr:biotin/lipoyl-binding protein [Pseudomonadota bacterium]